MAAPSEDLPVVADLRAPALFILESAAGAPALVSGAAPLTPPSLAPGGSPGSRADCSASTPGAPPARRPPRLTSSDRENPVALSSDSDDGLPALSSGSGSDAESGSEGGPPAAGLPLDPGVRPGDSTPESRAAAMLRELAPDQDPLSMIRAPRSAVAASQPGDGGRPAAVYDARREPLAVDDWKAAWRHFEQGAPQPAKVVGWRRDASSTPRFVLCPDPDAEDLYAPIGLPGGEKGDSGTDLRFAADVTVPSGPALDGVAFAVGLGVRARCLGRPGWPPEPYLLLPRSSLGKTPLSLANAVGLVDAGYTGELRVALRNHSAHDYTIARGTSLFQLVAPGLVPATVEVADAEHPLFAEGATARGVGGYGSTGVGGSRR